MKKIRSVMSRALAVLLTLGLLAEFSSQSQRASASNEKVKKETKDAVEASKDSAQKKAEYQKKVESQLDEFVRGINELKMKAEKSGAKAKAELDKEIAAVEQQKEVVSKKLSELKSSSSAEAWDDFKSRMDSALNELKKSYDRAVSRFKERR